VFVEEVAGPPEPDLGGLTAVPKPAEAGTDDQYLVLCCGIMESPKMGSCLECETR
jgi:hypothetical protein